MKNNKGFTLIELIVTISLLAIISVIAFVSINGIIEKSKDTNCENLLKNIENAAKEYISDHRYDSSSEIFTGDICDINVSNLIGEYIEGPIVDPYNSSSLPNENIEICYKKNRDGTLKSISSVKYNGNAITCNGSLTD